MWHYWDGKTWRTLTIDQLRELQPPPAITADKFGGSGALDPKVRIAVRDAASKANVVEQHRRYRMAVN